jgi:hypothetical protein
MHASAGSYYRAADAPHAATFVTKSKAVAVQQYNNVHRLKAHDMQCTAAVQQYSTMCCTAAVQQNVLRGATSTLCCTVAHRQMMQGSTQFPMQFIVKQSTAASSKHAGPMQLPAGMPHVAAACAVKSTVSYAAGCWHRASALHTLHQTSPHMQQNAPQTVTVVASKDLRAARRTLTAPAGITAAPARTRKWETAGQHAADMNPLRSTSALIINAVHRWHKQSHTKPAT